MVREALETADDLKDADAVDVFSKVSRKLDQLLWFVEAHLQDEK